MQQACRANAGIRTALFARFRLHRAGPPHSRTGASRALRREHRAER